MREESESLLRIIERDIALNGLAPLGGKRFGETMSFFCMQEVCFRILD